MYQKGGRKCIKVAKKSLKSTANVASANASRNPKFINITRCEDFCIIQERYFTLGTSFVFCHLNGTKTERIYPSAPPENKTIDLEQRLAKKFNDVNSFNNSVNSIKELTTYLKKIKIVNQKKFKNYKSFTSKLESLYTVVNIGSTTTSVTLSVTGVGLIVLQISAGIACALSSIIGDKVLHKISLSKYNKCKKTISKRSTNH